MSDEKKGVWLSEEQAKAICVADVSGSGRMSSNDARSAVAAIREQLKPKRAEHTPGPWKVYEESGEVAVCADHGQDYHIATIDGITGTVEEFKANARLIAQAPAMLAELEVLIPYAEKVEAFYSAQKKVVDEKATALRIEHALAVIAKAKGEG